MFGNAAAQQQRDTEKSEACQKSGITCIHIPMYWDGTLKSLSAILREKGIATG